MRRALIPALLVLAVAPFARADDLARLVDRYIAWRGGPAFARLRTIHQQGQVETAGLHGTFETWLNRDGRQRNTADLGVIKQVQVATPDQAWDTTPSGQVETTPVGDATAERRAALLAFGDALRGRGGATATLAGTRSRDGRAWSVVRVGFGDDDRYDVLIDPASGELGGYDIVENFKPRFEGFGDWRTVEGVRMPFLQTTTTPTPGGDETDHVAALELNRPTPPELFARPAPVHKAAFKPGARSTGWIDFEFYARNRIFFHARVNGRDTVVLLDSGAESSGIDKAWAAELGLKPKGGVAAMGSGGSEVAGVIEGIKVEIGDLTLNDLTVFSFDFAPVARRVGRPLPFVLGNELFNEVAVDIDFAHHRIAFSDPGSLTPPAGAAEVPLIQVVGNRSVPVSIEGRAPVQFDLDLGNGSPLVVFPAYEKAQRLLDGRRSSQLLGGAVGGYHPEAVASLGPIRFAGVDFLQVPARFSPDTVSGMNSNRTLGNIGLPILSRFHLVIDYSRDRLWAAPYADAATAPFAKDRLGLALRRDGEAQSVEFVSPDSPAAAAGFKTGDAVVRIDGRPAGAWTEDDLRNQREGAAGSIATFTLKDGTERRVTLADYF
jgi:hypothetical protein